MNDESKQLKQLAYDCSRLRRQGKPVEVIKLTDDVLRDRTRYDEMDGFDRILCTRGAAFRDLGNFREALACALESIAIKTKFCYAFNLAGAVYYSLGQFTEGDRYFADAGKRGTDGSHIEHLKFGAKYLWQLTQQKPELSTSEIMKAYPVDDYYDEDFDFAGSIDDKVLREIEHMLDELGEQPDSLRRSENED